MRYKIFSCLLLVLVTMSFHSPQFIAVKGRVVDSKNKPLPNVVIIEKGTTNQSSTDNNGDFNIRISSDKSKLRFEAAGFNAVEVDVVTSGPMLVRLTKNSKDTISASLSDVVVTGVQTMRFSTKLSMGNGTQKIKSAAPLNYNKQEYSTTPQIPVGPSMYYPDPERYETIIENGFLAVSDRPLSTFSIDVDAASYSNIRRFINSKTRPPDGSVRIEEMINYFHYDYPQPLHDDPFSINTEIAACPWNTTHQLVLVGLQGRKIAMEKLPPSNLVFLIDVSGSMWSENKLPLVKQSMKLLVDQLREQDMVSIVVYAGTSGLVLTSTSGAEKMKIKNAIDQLEAGGSTAGGDGIKLAYKTALNSFIPRGNNRVILCTDGDFNVGVSNDDELERLIETERKSGIFLTVLGYGMGNYKDNKMQKLADKGNGNHAYIDGINEAKKVLVNEFGGTLFTIAKDVKLQVEFNPSKVQSYRLVGYENRMLNKEDFNNDSKDAGELGSGHTVTALYEVIPAGVKSGYDNSVDPLKYQQNTKPVSYVTPNNAELMNIKFRCKDPSEEVSRLIVHPVNDTRLQLENASSNFRFAAAVAEFGMLLRHSEYSQSSSYERTKELAKGALGKDEGGYRAEFLELVGKAELMNDH